MNLADLPKAYQTQIASQLYPGRSAKAVSLPKDRLSPIQGTLDTPQTKESPTIGFFEASGLGICVAEYRFFEGRKWRFDYAWPKSMVALEVEGAVFTNGRHTRGSGFVKDMAKYNAAAQLGWRLLRVQPKELHSEATIELIRSTLAYKNP